MTKKTVCIYISEYAKIKLTERANALGLNLSNYLEYLSRQRIYIAATSDETKKGGSS